MHLAHAASEDNLLNVTYFLTSRTIHAQAHSHQEGQVLSEDLVLL